EATEGPQPPPEAGPQMPGPSGAAAAPKAGGDLRRQLGKAGRGPGFEIVSQLAEAKLVRAVDSERQLREVMADFWFNHFNVFAGKMNEAALLPAYERTIREHALGNFGELLRAVAHSPAMLIYLDNWRSALPRPEERRGRRGRSRPAPTSARRRGINENYARALLELHTLGDDGGYTREGVTTVARCATGGTSGASRAVVRTILESPGFWSRRALRAKVRSPLELVAGSVRALDARVDEPVALLRAVARIGEPLYAAQPPTGYLDTARNWLSSGALLARIDFGLALASGQLDGVLVDL